ncbi:putative lipid II flippase FtsW [Terrilactibacillus laevilacticus]|uniref:putative lipid II flippase FtsW n=1 Tax=Terrilactibacillus laevilacticus TaxID=1380157 RepID=UPI001146F5CD|nr:putative lipid II flippase FtsW [Terrilactibacillus laevilacticus]
MLKKLFRHYDYSLIVTICMLLGLGLIMVYSASMVVSVSRYERTSAYFFQRQLIWSCLGIFAGLVGMIIPYKIYMKFVKPITLITIFFLILLFVVGHTSNNAQSWFALGGFNIQPSEMAKLTVIVYLASVFAKKQAFISNFKTSVLPPLILICVIFILVEAQPDLGTAMIIAGVAGTIIICSGIRAKHIITLLILSLIAVTLMFTFMISNVQSDRFQAAYDPFSIQQGAGKQLVNSYIAIASGGFTGKGLGQSIEKAGFLPEPHTDFIIAIIGEELGFIGVLFVIICLAYLVLKGIVIAIRCKDVFGSLLAIGVSSLIAIQTFVNLGAATGLLPITGVTLPFISYGGSSLVMLLFTMGVLINISAFVNIKRSHQANQGEKENAIETH